MLEYKIIESKIQKIKIDYTLIKEEQVSIEAKATAKMKIPKDKESKRVLFEITFEAEEKTNNNRFIEATGMVIFEFYGTPDYQNIPKEEYPNIAMKNIVNKIDNILCAMGFDNFKFSE